MHVISLIDNATFFKPIGLAYILSERDQELARPRLLPRTALAAMQENDVTIIVDASQHRLRHDYVSSPGMGADKTGASAISQCCEGSSHVGVEKMFCITYDRFCTKTSNEHQL